MKSIMYLRSLMAVILSSLLMFAIPEPVTGNPAIAYIDIQPQITQLSENLTILTDKSQRVDAEIKCRREKNGDLDLAIAAKKRERDEVFGEKTRLQTSIEEYSNRVQQSQRQIMAYKSKIHAMEAAKNKVASDCGFLKFICKPLADLASEISGLENQIRDAKRDISSKNRELNIFQNNLAENQREYDQISRQLTELEKASQALTEQMKQGKELLRTANILSRDLKISIGESEELKQDLVDRKLSEKRLQKRLTKITELNQQAKEVLQSVDTYLLSNA